MRRCLTVTVLVCLWTIAACGEYEWDVTPRYNQGTPYDFTDEEREAIVGKHNDIRASVRARNMLRLVSNVWPIIECVMRHVRGSDS